MTLPLSPPGYFYFIKLPHFGGLTPVYRDTTVNDIFNECGEFLPANMHMSEEAAMILTEAFNEYAGELSHQLHRYVYANDGKYTDGMVTAAAIKVDLHHGQLPPTEERGHERE